MNYLAFLRGERICDASEVLTKRFAYVRENDNRLGNISDDLKSPVLSLKRSKTPSSPSKTKVSC